MKTDQSVCIGKIRGYGPLFAQEIVPPFAHLTFLTSQAQSKLKEQRSAMKMNTFRITLAIAAMALTASLLLGTSASAQPGDDTTPPQVMIHSPSSGETVSGRVNVTFSAFDSGGLMKFELYVDGELQQTILPNSRTQHFTWNCNKAGKGDHELLVKAYDASGNVGTSATCYVYTEK